MQCVILAGGLATRMRSITENRPKILLPVADQAFVEYQLRQIARTGVTRVTFCLGLLGEQVREYVQDGSRWNLKVDYTFEGDELRGSGGALQFARESGLLEDRFLATYGDTLLQVPFAEVFDAFLASGEPALMSIYENQGRWDQSNVWASGGKIRLYSKSKTLAPDLKAKMHFIDYGLLGFSRDLFGPQNGKPRKWDLAELLEQLSKEGRLAAWESPVRFYEIGSPAGFQELDNLLRSEPR